MKLGVAWQLLRAARLLLADPEEDRLVSAVQSALDDQLRRPKYRGHENPLTGHCYVASEALFYLLGGKAAGWTPCFISHEGEPHWFLRNADGRILDATASQFKTPVPYEKARGKGFLTLKPSKRAQAVISKVQGVDKSAGTAPVVKSFGLNSKGFEAADKFGDGRELLVHACEVDDAGLPVRPLCNRVKIQHIMADSSEGDAEPVTCPVCLRKMKQLKNAAPATPYKNTNLLQRVPCGSTKLDTLCARCGQRRGEHADSAKHDLPAAGCEGFKRPSAVKTKP